MNDDALMTLEEACATMHASVKAPTLREAAYRGELVLEKIGKRVYVTPQAIREWRQRCREKVKVRGSGFDSPARTPSGSSKTPTASDVARDAALLTVQGLRELSKPISPRSTRRTSAR